MSITREKGKIDCSGAAALWGEYIRRAPREGQGSGGFVRLDGWTCISARPPEAPLLGHCTSGDGGEFSVQDADAP